MAVEMPSSQYPAFPHDDVKLPPITSAGNLNKLPAGILNEVFNL